MGHSLKKKYDKEMEIIIQQVLHSISINAINKFTPHKMREIYQVNLFTTVGIF